jgi:hypothetical protein
VRAAAALDRTERRPRGRGEPRGPPLRRYLLRAREELSRPRVTLAQDGRTLLDLRLRRLGPGRSASLPPAWTSHADPDRGPVVARALSARRPRC